MADCPRRWTTSWIWTSLLLCLLGTAFGADDHDHDHDHDEEVVEGKHWEWAGSFDMVVGVHTFTLSKVSGRYADPTMLLAMVPVTSLDMGVESVEPRFNALLEHAKYHCDDEDAKTNDHFSTCAKELKQGGQIKIHEHDGEIHVGVWKLVVDNNAAMTMFLINCTIAGRYALATEHQIEEKDRHFLQGPDGEDLEPFDDLPKCVNSGLPYDKAWGYSIIGSLIGQILILFVSLFILYPLISKGGLNRGNVQWILTLSSLMSSFAVGILMGLIFLHLIPEAASLAGGFDWRISTMIIAGFFVGLFIELLIPHEHSHDPEFIEAAPQAGLATPTSSCPTGWVGNPHFQLGQPFPVPPVGVLQEEGAASLPVTTRNLQMKNLEDQNDAVSVASSKFSTIMQPVVINIVVGDFFHNLFDGVAIGTAFLACGNLGWVVTLSVLLHELPQEVSDFCILIRANLSVPKALLANLVSASSTFIGVIIAMTMPSGSNADVSLARMLAFAAGILLFVTVEILERVNKRKDMVGRFWILLVMASGMIIIGVLGLMHIHCHTECGHPQGQDEDAHDGHAH